MATTTMTFDFGAYAGRPTLDETEQDTESLDFGAYGGRETVTKQTAAEARRMQHMLTLGVA